MGSILRVYSAARGLATLASDWAELHTHFTNRLDRTLARWRKPARSCRMLRQGGLHVTLQS
eukprot:643555-Amphidinium_carterae.1